MKYNLLILVFIVFVFQSCSGWKKALSQKGNYETAIRNAVIDFSHTSSLVNKDKIFSINYKDYDSNIIGISILGDINKIYIVEGSPTRGIKDQYFEYNNKLFYWYDDKKSRDSTIIKKLSEYKIIDSVTSITEDMGYIVDDAKKAVNYYFCKNNLSIYKKETTSIAMPREIRKDLKLNCE